MKQSMWVETSIRIKWHKNKINQDKLNQQRRFKKKIQNEPFGFKTMKEDQIGKREESR